MTTESLQDIPNVEPEKKRGRPSLADRFFSTTLPAHRKSYQHLLSYYAKWIYTDLSRVERDKWTEETFNFAFVLAMTEMVGVVTDSKMTQAEYWSGLEQALISRLDEKLLVLEKKTGMRVTTMGLYRL